MFFFVILIYKVANIYIYIYMCVCVCVCVFMYMVKKVGDIVEDDPNAPLSIASVGEAATPFPGLLHFTLDPFNLILLGFKQAGIK